MGLLTHLIRRQGSGRQDPDQFAGYSIRAATSEDGRGLPWVLERYGEIISRHRDYNTAYRRMKSLFGAPGR